MSARGVELHKTPVVSTAPKVNHKLHTYGPEFRRPPFKSRQVPHLLENRGQQAIDDHQIWAVDVSHLLWQDVVGSVDRGCLRDREPFLVSQLQGFVLREGHQSIRSMSDLIGNSCRPHDLHTIRSTSSIITVFSHRMPQTQSSWAKELDP